MAYDNKPAPIFTGAPFNTRGACARVTTGKPVACAKAATCATPCGALPREVTVAFGTGQSTIDGRPVLFEEAAAAQRAMSNEPLTRLEMLREMHTEATQELELAVAEQRPIDVYTHGEAVAACEELITYFSTI